MTKQPEALVLAEQLKDLSNKFPTPSHDRGVLNSAIDELRRLHEANVELLAALNAMLTHMGMDEDDWNKPTFSQARAAIAKATGEPE